MNIGPWLVQIVEENLQVEANGWTEEHIE
jgi:hypothetical protein